jgi:hypothetical protein
MKQTGSGQNIKRHETSMFGIKHKKVWIKSMRVTCDLFVI